MALIGHNTDFISKKPVVGLFDDFDLKIKAKKFKQDFKVKPFPILQTKYKSHRVKPFKEKHLDIDDNLNVKKFKTIQDKDGNYFLEEYGILNKKNIKIEELPKVPAPDIRLNNLRKELGININNVNNPDAFFDLYEEYSKKKADKDHQEKTKTDKDYKEKEEAILQNPKIKDKDSKIKALRENKEKIIKNIGIKPVVETIIEPEIEKTIKHKEEKKTKKPIKFVEETGINTDDIENRKKRREIMNEIVKTIVKEDKLTPAELTKVDKATDTDFDFKDQFKDIQESIKEIKKDIEKIEESDKSKKEKEKLKKNLIKEEKQKIDKIMEDSTDDIKEDIEEQPKKEVQTSTDKETNIIEALNDGYLPIGEVDKNVYIHEMIQTENKFKHIIKKLKPKIDSESKNLNKEAEEYFDYQIMPLLNKFNIDKEKLYKLFNKKPKHNLQYRNLSTLDNAIKKFLKEKLVSLEKSGK